jgi:hypothetical protein
MLPLDQPGLDQLDLAGAVLQQLRNAANAS